MRKLIWLSQGGREREGKKKKRKKFEFKNIYIYEKIREKKEKTRGKEKEREGKKNVLVATVEQGVFSWDQFYFWNMLLSGRGQHLLPLFSIIQNKY